MVLVDSGPPKKRASSWKNPRFFGGSMLNLLGPIAVIDIYVLEESSELIQSTLTT